MQDMPRRELVPFGDQNPPWQYTERAFQHAHVLVEHHGTNAGTLKQGHHCRYQNHVIGANEFAQFALFLLPRRQRFYKALFYVVWHPPPTMEFQKPMSIVSRVLAEIRRPDTSQPFQRLMPFNWVGELLVICLYMLASLLVAGFWYPYWRIADMDF